LIGISLDGMAIEKGESWMVELRTAPHQELGVSFSFSFPLKVAVLEYPHDEILFLQQDGM